MTDHGPRLCDSCGIGHMELVDQHGHKQTFRCPACGTERSSLGHSRLPGTEPLEAKPGIRVFLAWNRGRPTAEEIVQARKLLPRFASMPLGQLKATMGNAARWDLGLFRKGQAKQLEAKAKELGLHIQCEATGS